MQIDIFQSSFMVLIFPWECVFLFESVIILTYQVYKGNFLLRPLQYTGEGWCYLVYPSLCRVALLGVTGQNKDTGGS